MQLESYVYSVLVASDSKKFCEKIASLLSERKFSPVVFEASADGARRRLFEMAFDMVIVNSPKGSCSAAELAADVTSSGGTVVLVFVDGDAYEATAEKLIGRGVFVLKKPVAVETVTIALDLMRSTRERLKNAEKKTVTLQEKMEEIRVVNRAKWILIRTFSMSEQEAHRFIEKKAMDECVSRREVAENIIKTYNRTE